MHKVLIIGRGDRADFRVDDQYASPRHAVMTIYPEGSVTVADGGSTNGLYLDGQRVYGPTPCGPDSVILVGRTKLKVINILRSLVS